MILTISEILTGQDLDQARALMDTLRWQDGAETAGPMARAVKQNLQADLSSRTGAKLRDLLHSAITRHPVLTAAAMPKRFSHLLVSKTEDGGGYGMHVDNAFMLHRGPGDDKALRTDLSFTLFLSAPETYKGGELTIEHAGQSLQLKPQAGELILYPATSLHAVEPVYSGTRIACVGWIESHIPRAEDRETLFDLANLKAELTGQLDPQSPEMLILAKTLANLKRRLS